MNQNLGLKHNKLLVYGFAVVTIVGLLIALFSILSAVPSNLNIFLCADTLYLPSLYNDLFIDKYEFRWHLNPAPNFFPDMVFYFLLMYLSGNFLAASFIFSIVQYLVIVLLFIQIFRLVFPDAPVYYHLLICTLLSLYLLEPFFLSKDFLYVFYMISNSYHTGAFVMTLLCFFLVLKYILKPRWIWLLLLFLIGFLCVVSDRLFVVLFAGPTVLTCLILAKRISARSAVSVIAVILLFVIAGMMVFKEIDTDIYFRPVENIFDFKIIGEQFKRFFTQIWEFMLEPSIRALSVYLFFASLIVSTCFFFKTLKAKEDTILVFYLLFSIVFSVGALCAPMLTQRYQDYSCLRYNVYPLFLSLLHAPALIALWRRNAQPTKRSVNVLLGLNAVLLLIGASKFTISGLNAYFNYYPDIVKEVDEVAVREKLKYGVANYWEAKKITMFSKTGVKVYAVFDDIALHNHVANDNWFFKNIFNFVVLNGFSDTTLYKEKLKDIRVVSSTPKLKMVTTHPFWYYEPGGYRAYNVE